LSTIIITGSWPLLIPPRIVRLDEFEIDEQLGEDVYVAREKETWQQVFLGQVSRESSSFGLFPRRVAVQGSLRLPGVSQFIGFGSDVMLCDERYDNFGGGISAERDFSGYDLGLFGWRTSP
jgi:hypothetical protein